MEYIIIKTAVISENQVTRTAHQVTAENITTAHQAAAAICGGCAYRVYYDIRNTTELQQAAIQIVKSVTKSLAGRVPKNSNQDSDSARKTSTAGYDTIYTLYSGVRQTPITDHDVLDCISVATLSLLDSLNTVTTLLCDSVDSIYMIAYNAVQKYIYSNRNSALTPQQLRTLYIEDINGEIVNTNNGINTIVKHNDRYIPTATNDSDRQAAIEYIVRQVASDLTPRQKTVLIYLARGYSVRQIQAALHLKSPNAVQKHIQLIRKKAVTRFPNVTDSINDIACAFGYSD